MKPRLSKPSTGEKRREREPWSKHPHPNRWSWEMQEGPLRARIYPVRHHATIYCWVVVVCDQALPLHTDVEQYVKIAGGDSLSFENDEALSESKRDAQTALERAQRCTGCDGTFDPNAQFMNMPGDPCRVCASAGFTTTISGLPTGVMLGGNRCLQCGGRKEVVYKAGRNDFRSKPCHLCDNNGRERSA